MRFNHIILLLISTLFLSGWGGCKDGLPFDWEGLILEKNSEWDAYRDNINGDYQFTYNTSGFSIGTEIEYFVVVKNNQVENLPEVNGDKTMDDFYNEILGYLYDENCTITVDFGAVLPVIESYTATCGEEKFGANLRDFQQTLSKF